MFPLRHAAARLLTSRSVSLVSRPRTITSFASISVRPSRIAAPLQFQRRWASAEAEAKKESESVPVSEIQPTPQEEVENAIQEDKAATHEVSDQAQASESGQNTQNADADVASDASEQAAVKNALHSQSPASNLTRDFEGAEKTRDYARAPREAATPKETIYVGNLFFDVTEKDLEKEFSRFGTVKNIRLIKDVRGLSKGFGYIEFDSTDNAQAAIDALNQQTFEGRRLMVSFAYANGPTPRAERRNDAPQNPPSKTLFIGNMSFEMTDRDLNNLFRGIRNVIDVRVAIDRRTGQPRGFAHADFVDVKSAVDAMKVLQGKENYGRTLRVDYSYGSSSAPRNTPR